MSTPALSDDHPFPGLRPFGFNDRKYFFGRDEQIYGLYRLASTRRFVAVVGSSGSGKSSLVSAGLLPLLEEEASGPRKRPWHKVEVRPGDIPIMRLADELAKLGPSVDEDQLSARRLRIAFKLRESSFGLSDALHELNLADGATLVLVIDQFEELFRFARDPTHDHDEQHWPREEAQQFVQLLLEASRIATVDVRVLLTMRSDFIGDCSRFDGLPEAVSAAQFLVPGLTRDQREEVIRGPLQGVKRPRGAKPTREPNATIEPGLVQTLLNDSDNDLDMLPVLQHCLLRLWDEAARPTAATGKESGASPAQQDQSNSSDVSSRHLTLDHYRKIGQLKGALSQHAEEILAKFPELTLAVEQIFRALAEIDRDKRVIRRPRLFSELKDEIVPKARERSGVSEADLRRALNRFRADDCSFLVPSSSAVPDLAPDTRVDVGHEALLRRWERVSGRPDMAASAPGATGWLRAEERDGQRYRALLTRLDNNPDATLSGKELSDSVTWWTSRPHTEAWAERYGGGIKRVQGLLERSQKLRIVWRVSVAASIVAAVAIAATTGYLVVQNRFERERQIANAELDRQRQVAAAQREIAERSSLASLTAATTLLSGLLENLNKGTIPVKAAEGMMLSINKIVDGVKEQSPAIDEARVRSWLVDSDVKMTLGLIREELEVSTKARETARDYVSKNPNDLKWLSLLYGSLWRVADALAHLQRTPQDLENAMLGYREAEKVARTLAAMPTNNGDWDRNVATMLGQVGDVWKIWGKPEQALEPYRASVDLLTQLTNRNPKNKSWQRSRAAAIDRVGQALAALKRYDEALEQFRAALAIREEQGEADYDTYQLNVALGYTNIGRALRDKGGAFDEALITINKALIIREALFEKDPSSAPWQAALADIYSIKGELLSKDAQNYVETLDLYRKAYSLRRGLAVRDAENPTYQRGLMSATDRLGKLLVGKEPDEAIKVYRSTLEVAAKQSTIPDDYAKQRRLFDLHVNIGDLLATPADARKEYQAALEITAGVTDRLPAGSKASDDWIRRRQVVEDKVRKLAN